MDYSAPEGTQADIATLLGQPPTQLDDGRYACNICHQPYDSLRAVELHRATTHRRMLDRDAQLRIPGALPCPQCDVVATSQSRLDDHLRRVHKQFQQASRQTTSAVATTPPKRNGIPHDVTAHEAGLAILAGLAPDGLLPVQRLGEVLDWLAQGEAIVQLANQRRQ